MVRRNDPINRDGADSQPVFRTPVYRWLAWSLLIVATAVPVGLRAAESVWKYESHPDPFQRGSSIHLASIERHDARLTVRCASSTRSSEVRIYLDPALITSMTGVTWKFDQRKSQDGKWQASANHRSIVVPPALQEDFVAQMRARQELSVTVVTGSDQTTEFVFPLSGSSVTLFKAMTACS